MICMFNLILFYIFNSFRDQCLKVYDLDPSNYLTAPGLSWDACLKTSDVRLDLITDQEMLLLIEEGIRGSITQAVTKYSEANNKIMDYDKNKESTYLQYYEDMYA